MKIINTIWWYHKQPWSMQASRARAYNKGMIFTRRHDLSLVPSSLNISGDTHFHPITIITKDDPKLRDSQWLNSHRSSPVGRLSGTSLMWPKSMTLQEVSNVQLSQSCKWVKCTGHTVSYTGNSWWLVVTYDGLMMDQFDPLPPGSGAKKSFL